MSVSNTSYIIYKAVNTIEDMVYIGATSTSLDIRISDHLLKAEQGQGSKFQEAIGTYGPEAFSWGQIDTANNPNELAKKEKQYILEYNSKENGYNSDVGGGIKKTIYQYDADGSFISEYDRLENAANAVCAYKTCVGNACLGQNKTCKGFYWSYSLYDRYPIHIDARKKKVLQLELDGEIVGEFESVSKASQTTGISKTCISRCCRGEREYSRGYRWEYRE